jgi:mono/diheme cytochrome c family protein
MAETNMRAALIRLTMFVGALALCFLQPAFSQTPGGATSQSPPLTAEEVAALKNTVPFSNDSIAVGKKLYLVNNCAACHGSDGKALLDIVAENATDLTDPKFWNNGTEPGQIFKSLRDGAGPKMPAFKGKIADEDLWRLVNFIESLWPADRQPSKHP